MEDFHHGEEEFTTHILVEFEILLEIHKPFIRFKHFLQERFNLVLICDSVLEVLIFAFIVSILTFFLSSHLTFTHLIWGNKR